MDERLKRFCDNCNGKYHLSTPWVQDGFMYATDGRIIVRVPFEGEYDNGGEKYPDGSSVFRPLPDVAVWASWPSFPENHGLKQCFACGGEGCDFKVCEMCDGDGSHKCKECGTYHGCGICDGKGEIPIPDSKCNICEGEGTLPKPIEVNGQWFGGHYCKWIGRLEYAEVYTHLTSCGSDDDDICLAFRASGGLEGRLMPQKEPKD